GERQRISLARAFLKDAPILILDEPTSAVDVGTEAAIIEAMERLLNGRTTFMIAHRLNTLENCDLRIELVAGRIAGLQHRQASSIEASGVPVVPIFAESSRQLRANSMLKISTGLDLLPTSNKN